MHIYILPQCSTTAARVLNPAGMDAQFERLRCAISRGILIYAHSEKECEQKLAELIVQTKAEIAAQRQQPQVPA